MNCTECGRAAAQGQRFCTGCGRALPAAPTACRRCGAARAPDDRYCGSCGATLSDLARVDAPARYTPAHLAERILRQRGAIEGERKEVTVLFADIKGSMDLAAAVDPEEWHAVLDRFFAVMAEGVHRFEGSINQYTGDGIMALFGAPLALEDHARHACTAALWLRDAVRDLGRELRREKAIDLAVRFGINSGSVVVGAIGDDLRMDYTAQGQVVGLAARMEQLAEAGCVYLAPAAAKLVESYFELEDLGLFQVKGMAGGLRVHELRGAGAARTRFDASRQRGLSRFVGRAAELAKLQAIAGPDDRQAPTRAVIVARAGQGKSRLCMEFLGRRRAAGAEVFEAVGLSHARTIAYLPLRQLFRAVLGVGESERGAAVRERVAGRILLLGEAFRGHVAPVCDLLGLDDLSAAATGDREVRRGRLVEVLAALLAGGDRETVLLLEDLHWFDAASESFTRELLQTHVPERVRVVATHRPEYDAAWMPSAGFEVIRLEPLGAAEMRELVDAILGGGPELGPLVETIAERAAGNPFFAEEIVRSLAESGALQGVAGAYRATEASEAPAAARAIPDSVQAVLAARIDRLDETAKGVLQAGSVIGKSFARPVLEAVCDLPPAGLDAAVTTLVERGFVYPTSRYPLEEYTFEHPLTQEVAERTMLSSRRRNLHCEVARAIEVSDPAATDENAALIAGHWEAGDDLKEAAVWHHRAARWCNLGDLQETLRHWKRIREIVPVQTSDARQLAIRLRACREILVLASRVGIPTPELGDLRREGHEAASRLDDAASRAAIESSFALNRSLEGDLLGALASLQSVRELAEKGGDPEALTDFALTASHVYSWSGRCLQQVEVCDLGLRHANAANAAARDGAPIGAGIIAWLHTMRGDGLVHHGDLVGGGDELELGLRMAEADRDAEIRGFTYAYLLRLHTLAGRYDEAERAATNAFRLAEESGSVGVWGTAAAYQSAVHVAAGRWHQAIEQIDGVVGYMSSGAIVLFRAFALVQSALAHAGAGDADAAGEISRRAHELADECGAAGYAALARLARAEAETLRGDVAAAGRWLAEAETLLSQLELGSFVPDVQLARARHATLTGDDAAAERWRRIAVAKLRQIGAGPRADAVEGRADVAAR